MRVVHFTVLECLACRLLIALLTYCRRLRLTPFLICVICGTSDFVCVMEETLRSWDLSEYIPRFQGGGNFVAR